MYVMCILVKKDFYTELVEPGHFPGQWLSELMMLTWFLS